MIEDYSYTAGLIDGEGTVGLTKYGRSKTKFRYPNITVPNCAEALVQYLHRLYGGSVSTKKTTKTFTASLMCGV